MGDGTIELVNEWFNISSVAFLDGCSHICYISVYNKDTFFIKVD